MRFSFVPSPLGFASILICSKPLRAFSYAFAVGLNQQSGVVPFEKERSHTCRLRSQKPADIQNDTANQEKEKVQAKKKGTLLHVRRPSYAQHWDTG